MTKLSDTQAIVLSAAAQRPDGNLLPLPGSLRGGAAGKVVMSLLTRGFVREHVTDNITRADAALNTLWRNEDDGRAVLLRITPAGLEAIGVDAAAEDPADASPEKGIGRANQPAAGGPTRADEAAVASAPGARPGRRKVARTSPDTAAPRQTREGTKQAQLIAMLQRPEGVTIEQIVAATGWQPHTVRGAFAGALKKKLGLTVTSEKVDGARVYRIES